MMILFLSFLFQKRLYLWYLASLIPSFDPYWYWQFQSLWDRSYDILFIGIIFLWENTTYLFCILESWCVLTIYLFSYIISRLSTARFERIFDMCCVPTIWFYEYPKNMHVIPQYLSLYCMQMTLINTPIYPKLHRCFVQSGVLTYNLSYADFS